MIYSPLLRSPMIGAALLLGMAVSAQAATLRVPEQHATVADAVAAAQAGDTILIAPGVYPTVGVAIDKSITLRGTSPERTILFGKGADRVLSVVSGLDVAVTDLTIMRGRPAASPLAGGGILNRGNLRVERCWLLSNSAETGGGIAHLDGSLSLVDCLFQHNDAGSGGGLYSNRPSDLRNVTFRRNTAATTGGGITSGGALAMRNVTLSANSAPKGGGLYNATAFANATMLYSTVTGNAATGSGSEGGGIHNNTAGVFQVKDSIIAHNTAGTGPDVRGPVTLPERCIVTQPSGSTGFSAVNETLFTDPKLAPLSFFAEVVPQFPVIAEVSGTGMSPSTYTGAPDDAFFGLGGQSVTYDFGPNLVLDEAGPDLNVYEVDWGNPEFAQMDISVSLDGQEYVSIKASEGMVVRLPGDSIHGNDAFARSYDLDSTGLPAVRYVRIKGTGSDPAGTTTGFDLDAVGAIHTPTDRLPLPVHALLPGSPAIERVSVTSQTDPPTDARGVIRPQDADLDAVYRADTGAFEVQARHVVTNTNDSGPGSLRQALMDADRITFLGGTRVEFNIPGEGVHVIALESPLPTIDAPVFIDGLSQPGSGPAPRVILDGQDSAVNNSGIKAGARDVTIRGLGIRRFRGDGVLVVGNNAGARVQGNVISGNSGEGVYLASTSGNVIGSNRDGLRDDAEANVIVGNGKSGIILANSNNNLVSGNYIGVLPGGQAGPGNSEAGVFLSDGVGNSVLGNSIAYNGGIGIDLWPPGRTGNDFHDTDTGANTLINYPILSDLSLSSTLTKVKVFLHSGASTPYRIEIFSSATAEGEGRSYLGAATLVTEGDHDAEIMVDLPVPATGPYITATATDPDGNTSEFSGVAMETHTIGDARRALGIAAGLLEEPGFDTIRLNVVAGDVSGVDLIDALYLCRRAARTPSPD